MTRSRSWVLAIVFGVVGIALAAPAQQGDSVPVRTLSIATLAPQGSTWMNVFDAWNREVRRRSNRTLQLRFYPSGVQGDEVEVIRKIRAGRLDGAAVTAIGLSQIYRPAIALQLPGLFAGYAQLDHAREALAPEMNAAFAAAGFQLMGWADVGRARIFSQTPVHTPAEFAAQRPWAWRDDTAIQTFYRMIHANPVLLQVPEVLSALQTHRVNAFIAAPVAAVSLQWTSQVSHMTDLAIGTTIGATVIGQAQWARLSPEQQTILRETATQFHALARRNLRNDEARALETLPEHHIAVVTVDAAQRALWEQAFAQIRQQLTGQIADAAFITRLEQLAR